MAGRCLVDSLMAGRWLVDGLMAGKWLVDGLVGSLVGTCWLACSGYDYGFQNLQHRMISLKPVKLNIPTVVIFILQKANGRKLDH